MHKTQSAAIRQVLAGVMAAGALATAPVSHAAAPAGPMADARLLQITLPSRDLAKSVAFYQDQLGVKLLFQVKGAAFFDAGGVRLRIEQSETAIPTGTVELYFDDPGLARAKPLSERGVRFVGPPETVQRSARADLQLLEFTDPDGNALALMGEVARP
jgi:catechol 2,3-dioxygenase-like lactoylglutathione lyase family enzyme